MPETPIHNHQSFTEARAQAAEFLGFIASEIVTIGDKTFEIPNPSLLDDDQQDRVNALDFDVAENWDRHPDILNDDGSVKTRGALMEPNRKGGQPVNYNRLLAEALFGDRYTEFKQAGGRANDIAAIWSKMRVEMEQRRKADDKSGGSDPSVEAVSNADRVGSPDPLPRPADS